MKNKCHLGDEILFGGFSVKDIMSQLISYP